MRNVFTWNAPKLQDLQEEKPATSLVIPESITKYLIDAFDVVNEYAHTHNFGDIRSTEIIRKYCNYIKTTSRCHKWALDPNNATVQEMARNGNTINDIWNKMKIDHPDTLQYVPQNIINEMFPKLEKEYHSIEDTNILKTAVSNNKSIKSLLYNSHGKSKHVFEKNLQLLIELCDISNVKVLAMIDIFHPGALIRALESVIAFQTVVMGAYYWCFIQKANSTGLIEPLRIYKDRVNNQICDVIRILSLYSDENNINESIFEETLERYIKRLWLPRVEATESILINNDVICSHTATNGFIINTIQPEYDIPNLYIANSLSEISDLVDRFRRVWNQSANMDTKRYVSLMDMYKGLTEESYQNYVHLKSMKYLMIQRFDENMNLPNDQNAHMVWTEGVRNIQVDSYRNRTTHHDHYADVRVGFYTPAVQKSAKKPLGTKTTYDQTHRKYSAMYMPHYVDENVLGETPRFAESISDLKPIGYITDRDIRKKDIIEIADMEDSTNGLHESPFYSMDEYGDIDRSSWEPRRNDWNK